MHSSLANDLFATVAKNDYLDITRTNEGLKHVGDFLSFQKNDVANASGKPSNSIRYDDRISPELKERLLEIGNIINLVASHYDGNLTKAKLWFQTKNPLIGNFSPREMIRCGRYMKLYKFVINAQAGNVP